MGGRRSTIAVTTAAIALAEVIGKIATLALTLVAARTLSTSDFGAFNFALSFALLTGVVPALGFNAVLTRRASRAPGDLRPALTQNLLWRAALGAPVFTIAAIIGVASRPDAAAATVLLVVLAAGALDLHDTAWRAAAAATQRQIGMYVALVTQRVVTASVAIGMLVQGAGVIGLAIAYLGGSVVGTVLVLVVARRLDIRPAPLRLGLEGFGPTLRESAVIGVQSIVAMALFRIDTVLIGVLVGDEEVATYTAAFRLVESVTFVAWAVSRATFPVMAASNDRNHALGLAWRGVAAVSAIYVPLGLVLAIGAPAIIGVLFGETYIAASTAPLRWLAPAPALFGLAFILGRALTAAGAERLTLSASCIALTFNVTANVVLLPRHGAVAAAATTSASHLIQATIVAWFAWRLRTTAVHDGFTLRRPLRHLDVGLLIRTSRGSNQRGAMVEADTERPTNPHQPVPDLPPHTRLEHRKR